VRRLLVKDRFYLPSQHFVLQAPGTLGFEGVVVEPAATQPKGPTQFSATIAVRWVMESLSHVVELLGSWPKMAKAFFLNVALATDRRQFALQFRDPALVGSMGAASLSPLPAILTFPLT